MRVVVLGASGLLGSNVVAAGNRRGADVVGTYYTSRPTLDCALERVDLRDADRVRGTVEDAAADVVVNCAAMTDVDRCESAPGEARAVNAEAPGHVAEACADLGARFVHVSTDYVFDGEATTPYCEDDEPAPVQAYGETKLAGETAVREAPVDALVVRPSFVYGVHRSSGDLAGFPAWVRDRLSDGRAVGLFDDQYVTPSRAGGVADAVFELLATGATGTYHVASRSCVTPYAFGRRVRERLPDRAGRLERDSLAAADRAAARPAYTCLDVRRVERRLGRPQPTLAEDVAEISGAV